MRAKAKSSLAGKEATRSLSDLIKASETSIVEIRSILFDEEGCSAKDTSSSHDDGSPDTAQDNIFSPLICLIEGGVDLAGENAPDEPDDIKKAEEGDTGYEDEPSSPNTLTITEDELNELKENIKKELQAEIRTKLEEELREERDKIIKDARKEAERIKKEAEKTLEESKEMSQEIEKSAYQDGFSRGDKEARDKWQKEYETTVNRLKKIIEAINQQGLALFSKYEAQMIELILKVSKMIVNHEISTSNDTIIQAVRFASQKVSEATSIKVVLHPDDMKVIEDAALKGIDLSQGHELEFIPKASVEQGGCIIETDFGLIDNTMENRWSIVEGTIKNMLQSRIGAEKD